MKPLLKYLKNLFATNRVLADKSQLHGLARADALFAALANDRQVPGMAVTVLKNAAVLLQKGYGCADIDKKSPVDPRNTIFRIASVSKPIAATALAEMVTEGTIGLDDSIYDHIPSFPRKQADITLRQLAGHTAGIRTYRGKEYALNKPYSIKDSLEVFQNDDLLFDPGKGYNYNSFDWVLISLAMQEAAKMPFETYVKQKVLAPLDMTNTFPEISSLDRAQSLSGRAQSRPPHTWAAFYSRTPGGFKKAVEVNNEYKLAGGGYLSTSEDIAKLGQAYLDRKIAEEKVLSEFLSSQTIDNIPTYYGLGWQVSEDKGGRPYYGHVGNGVGGYSNFFVYPEQQMVVVVLINCTDPKVQEVLDEAIDALFFDSGKVHLRV